MTTKIIPAIIFFLVGFFSLNYHDRLYYKAEELGTLDDQYGVQLRRRMYLAGIVCMAAAGTAFFIAIDYFGVLLS
ncbi:MAG: hypothetical protein WCV50_01725 [Patescibacteria group bacterium]